MTVKQFGSLAAAIKTFFPRENVLPTSESMDLWYDMLHDLDYDVASTALKMHVSNSPYAPTISDIRKYAEKIVTPTEMNESEAWALVSNAIRNSSYNSAEEFSKLPPLVQKAVGQPSQLQQWAIDNDYNESVVSSNFMRSYRAELYRKKEVGRLPQGVKNLLEQKRMEIDLISENR